MSAAPDVDASAEPAAAGAEQIPDSVTASPGVANDVTFETDRLAREVKAILDARCAACHGAGRAEGGFADVGDLARVIEQGAIVPGQGAQSPLVLRMLEGDSRHPTGAVGRASSGEVALTTRFIDRLPAQPAAACAAAPFQSLDAIYAATLADLETAPPQDRPFLRYLGSSYASNAGLCGSALDRQRSALFKLVNSVSTAPEIRVPRSVDARGTLYRIDVRDYAWNREIDLQDDGQVDFADAWLALVAAAGPYAVELEGPEAEALKRETTAAVPFLPVHALVHAASAGDLYYALVGVRRFSSDTRAVLGVTVQPGSTSPLAQQAGFFIDGLRRRESRVLRMPQGSRPGQAYWVIEDEYRDDAESIYEDPVGFGNRPWRIIFNLPNGLQAYEMDDRYGSRVTSLLPDCRAETCDDAHRLEPRNTAGCHACHEAGLVPFVDSVRAFVEDNPIHFDNETLDDVLRTYPRRAEFEPIIESDSQLQLDALRRAGVSSEGPEPISFVYDQFELDRLSSSRVAAELGVTEQALRSELARLDPRLGALQQTSGGIDRATMTEVYAGSLCALHSGSRNRPVACP